MTHFSLYLAFFQGFLTPLVGYAQTLTLKREDCLRFLQEDTSSDVTYKPGVDVRNRPVASADLDGGIKIPLPEVISIPIRFDLKKYFRIPQEVTRKTHQEIEKILQELSASDQSLQTDFKSVHNKNASALNNNAQITEEAALPNPDAGRIETFFEENLQNLRETLTILGSHPTTLASDRQKLEQTLQLLHKQFNPYEEDSLILDKNHALRETSQQSTASAQSNTTVSAEALGHTAQVYQQTKSLFDRTLHERGEKEDDLKVKIEEVGTLLQQVQQTYDHKKIASSASQAGEGSLQEGLSSIHSQFGQLKKPSQSYVDDAEVGRVTFHLKDHRLYFNGQPLFDEDRQKIKETCRKILIQQR